MSYRDYPVGKAQQTVLDALGVEATGFSDANRIFDELGIIVSSKRVGRKSVPVVEAKGTKARRNRYGDYDISEQGPTEEIAAKLAEWME